MKLQPRERQLLILLAVVAPMILVWKFGLGSSAPDVAEAATDSVEMAEKKLAKLRILAATVPGKELLLKQADEQLAAKETGVIQAQTAQQAQAQLLQVIRELGKKEDIDARGGELGPIRPLGDDYGEVSVTVSFECRIEQLVNFLADLSREPEIVIPSEERITTGNPKEKTMGVRMVLAGLVAKKLVPEKKGLGRF